ncbi:MAG: hypothetical protein E6P95_02655 [Candidatus Moraniibacteriota bacterium]|nr:MAG: hypothetical protein E6P95_02655 [Candidatus Moranbacteria bacterium]
METESNRKNTAIYKLSGYATDAFFVSAIVGFGWFLIGYYTQFEFLKSGYQDWIYHAFRVKDVAEFGVSSWDHIWANGINHWRAFQYIEHILAAFVVKITGLSITKAMAWIIVIAFIGVRVISYLTLRWLGIGRLISLLAVMISYAVAQQWVTVSDYSIYVGHIFVPLFVVIWIKALENDGLTYLLAALSGASWSLHPTIGYSLSGMFFLLLIANKSSKNFQKIFLSIIFFLVSSLPFTAPYFFMGYSIGNPVFVTPRFLQSLLINEHFGLSLIYLVAITFCWILLFTRAADLPRWSKLLLLYCTAYLVFIYFGLQGYFPDILNKFQFSRAIPFISLLFIFCFAAILQGSFHAVRSRLLTTIWIVLIVVSGAASIEISSRYTAQPINSIDDPVAKYFDDKPLPHGTIYYKDVPQASYVGKKGLRFITSYNQHLLPNPYPMQLLRLMKTDISYTGTTEKQVRLIEDYSLVLGIEYMFVPNLSPLVDALTIREGQVAASFEKVDEIVADSDVYAVLRSRQPISYAYAVDKSLRDQSINFSELPLPTLQATSYQPWDVEITKMAELIRSGALDKVELSFIWPDRLAIDGLQNLSLHDKDLMIMQSYDDGWAVLGNENISIKPTSLRFMYLDVPSGVNPSKLELKNSWPWWYWPVQWSGVVTILLTISILIITFLFRKLRVNRQGV